MYDMSSFPTFDVIRRGVIFVLFYLWCSIYAFLHQFLHQTRAKANNLVQWRLDNLDIVPILWIIRMHIWQDRCLIMPRFNLNDRHSSGMFLLTIWKIRSISGHVWCWTTMHYSSQTNKLFLRYSASLIRWAQVIRCRRLWHTMWIEMIEEKPRSPRSHRS